MGEFPKLNSEYYADITKQIRNGVNKIGDLNKAYHTLDNLINSGNYSGDKLHELITDRNRTRISIEDERKNQLNDIQALCDEISEKLRKEDDLNPNAVVSAELELLRDMSILNPRDLKAMIERNKDNSTMTQLILRHCQKNNIDIGLVYNGNDDAIRNMSIIPDIAKTIFKYDGGMEGIAGTVYNRLLGEGSDLANTFSPEND